MKNNLAPYIDRLGEIKAEIAKLKSKETKLKAVLIDQGPGAYEGNLFRVTVSTCTRDTLDMKAVRKKLSPTFIRENTTSIDVTTVKVVARNAIKLVA